MIMMVVGISTLVFLLFVFMLMTFILLDALIKERKCNEKYYRKLRRNYDIRIIFPWDINNHCFDSDYWDAKYEKSLEAKLQPDIKGIDVSHHQGNIDWELVKKAQPKLAFIYVKCTEGKSYVDPKFKDNANGAAAVGFRIGAYHYFRMTSGAHEQFQNFKAQMDAVHIELIPMVDVERDDGKPRKELQDSLKVLLDLLEKAYGKRPMIYGTNRSYNKLCAPEFNYYPLYIGRYGKKKPVITGPSHYIIWQYSENLMECRKHIICGG